MANISAQIKTIKNATHDEELREAIAEALTVLADADQSDAVRDLKDTLLNLSEKLDSKANSSDVTRIKLTSEEINKLNELKSAINDISRQMSLKANTSDVNKLKKELDGKADSTEVSRALSLKADSTATKSMMNLYSGDGQSALKAAVEEYATETVVNLLRSYTNEQLNLKEDRSVFDAVVGNGFQGWTITDYIIRIREDYNTALAEMMTRSEFRTMKAEALEQAADVVSVNDEMDDTTRLYLNVEDLSEDVELAEMSDLNALASNYDKYFTFNAPLVFEIGTLDEHGWNATSTVHIRTKDYLEARDFTYTLGTTHSVQVASYDEYKMLINKSAWLSGNVSFDIDNIAGIKYIKLVVKRNDEADITSAMLNTFNTSVNTNHLTMFGTDYIGDGEESVASSSLVATKADKDDLEKTANTIAPAYNPSSTYSVGDYVTYGGKLYRCSTAITTAESWTAGHWIESNVGGEISDLKEDLSEMLSDVKLTPLVFEYPNSYVDISKATANINNKVASEYYNLCIQECTEGDTFLLNVQGGGAPRAYAFLNSSGTILEVAENSARLQNKKVTAPSGTSILVVHDSTTSSGGTSYKYETTRIIDNVVRFDKEQALTAEQMAQARSNIGVDVLQKLLHDNVPGTIQNYTFTDGTVSKVEHKSENTVKRTDVFTYGTTSITEIRTLDSGESLTIVTNLSTLETSVTFAAA